jgi:hypothetical protein
VLSSHQDIQQELTALIKAMPGLLERDQGNEFWIEFLGVAESIKEQIPQDRRGVLVTRLHQILASCGVSPPSWWVFATWVEPGHA